MALLGVFDDGSKAAAAIIAIQHDALGRVDVYSPTPSHAIDQALDIQVSPVRTFTLIGGLFGCIVGFALPIYTVLDWPLITGGKPLLSIPPFVVIAFELTILFGATFGLLGFLGLARLPNPFRKRVSDPRFTNDKFGVLVTCDAARVDAVRAHLLAAGCEEVSDHA